VKDKPQTMNQDSNIEKDLFSEALELPPDQREVFLKGACRGDEQLRQRVEELLRVHGNSSRILKTGAEQPTILEDPRVLERPGTIIGRYKLLQKIGEGGCGVVYMAEQEEPVRRRVALKVIKLGMDTNSVIARFEAERQALALMDHPNIAKVFDAGATDTGARLSPAAARPNADARGNLSESPSAVETAAAGDSRAPLPAGRPYFVMELVRGTKVTDYCDQNNLSTRDRLDLFIKVCQAIQHAHQKGIIHRDIKPSNILVTLHDGVAVPKVIDFGIAKATTDQRLTDKTLFTALEQFIGTPAYMSPEQAEMSGLDIDTRCDIYSLGVLLYELLTGKTPFDAKELLASGLDEMRRTIREKEPLKPSTKLSQTLVAADVVGRVAPRAPSPSDDTATSGAHGATRPTPKSEEEVRASSRRLLRLKETITLLRGDLDWIVMKCLEKDRARRYETANGLASDIQRHLNNEAVLARPPSAAYRFQKLIRRNKLAFAAAAAVTLTLIAGLSFSTWAFLREAAQRRTAEGSAEQAHQAEQKAESAAAQITRNLYFAEMNLAGNAAAEPGGISRIAELTAKWRPEKGAADLRGWEWYYLRSLLHRDLFTLSGHTNEVDSVAWSPDGKFLVSGSRDGTIKVWDVTNGHVNLTLPSHVHWIATVASSVSWSPDGKRLASGKSSEIEVQAKSPL
jgi:serine/threonine protein kinase